MNARGRRLLFLVFEIYLFIIFCDFVLFVYSFIHYLLRRSDVISNLPAPGAAFAYETPFILVLAVFVGLEEVLLCGCGMTIGGVVCGGGGGGGGGGLVLLLTAYDK